MIIVVFGENRMFYEKMIYQVIVGLNFIFLFDYVVFCQIFNDMDYFGQVVEMGWDEYYFMGIFRGLLLFGYMLFIQCGIDYFGMFDNCLMYGWEYWVKYNNGFDVNWKFFFIGVGDEFWLIVFLNGCG